MSHYIDIETEIKNEEALVRALERVGFKSQVEVHKTAQSLYGYKGDARNQKANIIVRRNYVGRASNDIGWERNAKGSYVSHISEFDQNKYGTEWQMNLQKYYGVELFKMEFEKKGWKYKEDVDEKNRPRLRVRL